jgi:hypothetical protein
MTLERSRMAALTACLSVMVVGAFTSSSVLAAPSLYGANLIVNGDAEADAGAAGSSTIVKPASWTSTGEFTAVKYGASGGFPDAKAPGPKERGANFFAGGNVAKSTGTQSVDLSAGSTDIDAGSVGYAFSAWLGGYARQEDNTVATVTFADANGMALGSATLGPVTASARKGVTGLFPTQQSGTVPKGTHSGAVMLVMTRFEGTYNDGYTDNVSLVLTKKP